MAWKPSSHSHDVCSISGKIVVLANGTKSFVVDKVAEPIRVVDPESLDWQGISISDHTKSMFTQEPYRNEYHRQ